MLFMGMQSQYSEFHEISGKHQLLNLCFHENIFDSLESPPGAQIILLYNLPSCGRSLQAIPAKLQFCWSNPEIQAKRTHRRTLIEEH